MCYLDNDLKIPGGGYPEDMGKRLERLIGCNPGLYSYGGNLHLYNHLLSFDVTDNEIVQIHNRYLKWEGDIRSVLAQNGYFPSDEEFGKMFTVDGMFANLFFLDIPVFAESGVEPYMENITAFLKNLK